MTKKRKAGPSTPLDLLKSKKNVVVRVGATGLITAAFKPRRAPKGSLAYVRVLSGVSATDENAISKACERLDQLQAELERDREEAALAPIQAPPKSLPELVRLWQQHDAWKALKPRSQRSYEEKIRHILDWSKSCGHPPVTALTAKKIREFLKLYDDRQTQRQHLRTTLSMMLSIAVEEGWIDRNPAKDVILRRTQTKRPVTLWTPKDVELYCEAARLIGWPHGQVLYRTIWETGADPSDVVNFTIGSHLLADRPAVRFDRGKTGRPTSIPISRKLVETLQALQSGHFVCDPDGKPLDRIEDDSRVGWLHRKTSLTAIKLGARKLGLKHLRHSAATHAVESGASLEDVARLLAHADQSMARDVYVRETEAQLLDLQRKRGVIE